MKANEFVKEFGLELAKRDVAALASGFIKREAFIEHYGFDILDDLKRLVESHELVESYGGLSKARNHVERTIFKLSCQIIALKKAIADVESCQ